MPRPIRGWDEQDAYSAWRRRLVWQRGELAAVKRRTHKAERRDGSAAIEDALTDYRSEDPISPWSCPERWDGARIRALGHVPMQIGTRDGEGRRTFGPVGDVCAACSDPDAGEWVPMSMCPTARTLFEIEEAWRAGSGVWPAHWGPEPSF